MKSVYERTSICKRICYISLTFRLAGGF